LLILFGVLGGLVRAPVGIPKYFEKNKQSQKLDFGILAFHFFRGNSRRRSLSHR
jgi:hypothetical protein